MLPEFPRPAPEPIERFSPTLANDLLACPRRIGFARDPSFATWKRPSTFSVLGDATHAVAEFVEKHDHWPTDPSERRRHLELVWDDRVGAGAVKLAAAWAPTAPPPAQEWPTYEVTRARTIRRAERVIRERGEVVAKAAARLHAPDVTAGPEVKLTDPTSGLEGRADRIDRVDGSFRVVDLKTGMNQEEPKEGQLRQLLLYAVLVQRTTGEWPADIAVENASGEQFVVPLQPAEAEAALVEAQVAVGFFNELVSGGSDHFEARASADTCHWCAYRTCCDGYWRSLSADWGHASVLGSLEHAGTDGKGAHAELEIVAPADLGVTTAHIAGLPEEPPTTSTWLAAVDLHPIRDPRSLRARWSSRVATW
jgi:hypothetical protein